MSNHTTASAPSSVDRAQADVERIRADLAATVDALVAKADVAGRAKESAAHLTAEGRHRIEAAGEQVHETYDAARDRLRSGPIGDRVSPRTLAIGVGSAVLVVAAVLVGRGR